MNLYVLESDEVENELILHFYTSTPPNLYGLNLFLYPKTVFVAARVKFSKLVSNIPIQILEKLHLTVAKKHV
jgi:hypothetical protein